MHLRCYRVFFVSWQKMLLSLRSLVWCEQPACFSFVCLVGFTSGRYNIPVMETDVIVDIDKLVVRAYCSIDRTPPDETKKQAGTPSAWSNPLNSGTGIQENKESLWSRAIWGLPFSSDPCSFGWTMPSGRPHAWLLRQPESYSKYISMVVLESAWSEGGQMRNFGRWTRPRVASVYTSTALRCRSTR